MEMRIRVLLMMPALALGLSHGRPATAFKFFKVIADGAVTPEQSYPQLPKTISAIGLYSDMPARKVDPGIYPFEINNPLWSDGTEKSRYLVLPNDSVITYLNDTDEYVFPEGAVFIKNFSIDTVAGTPASRILIETRIMVMHNGIWNGCSFKWRKDQSDADLVGGAFGESEEMTFTIKGVEGKPRKKTWLFPGRSGGRSFRNMQLVNCNRCHLNSATGRQRSILGFITPQLARNVGGKDQILDLMEKGFLVKRAGATYTQGSVHRWYALDDSTNPAATLEARARSYLASNCSHCHSPEGKISCKPIYTYARKDETMNYMGAASLGNWGIAPPVGDSTRYIYPGKPEYSLILRRMSAADADGYRDTSYWDWPGTRRVLAKSAGWDGNGRIQMPPLATYEVNPLANQVFRDWINGMAGLVPGAAIHSRQAENGAGKIRIASGTLFLPPEIQGVPWITLHDLRGRTQTVHASHGGGYSLPSGLKPGTYSIRAGGKVYAFGYFPGGPLDPK